MCEFELSFTSSLLICFGGKVSVLKSKLIMTLLVVTKKMVERLNKPKIKSKSIVSVSLRNLKVTNRILSKSIIEPYLWYNDQQFNEIFK